LTKKKNIILVNVCIARFSKYDIKSMQQFWSKIKDKFEATIDCKYVEINRHINNLIIKRKVNIKALHKLEYATRNNNYTQTINR